MVIIFHTITISSVFDQVNAALMAIRTFQTFQKHFKKSYQPKHLNSSVYLSKRNDCRIRFYDFTWILTFL